MCETWWHCANIGLRQCLGKGCSRGEGVRKLVDEFFGLQAASVQYFTPQNSTSAEKTQMAQSLRNRETIQTY